MIAKRVWLSADYNQAEVRVVAWKGPVPKLKKWFKERKDVHNHVCELIATVVQQEKVSTPLNPATGAPLFKSKLPNFYTKGDEERELSKRCVHAYDYGMGAEKFALITGISYKLAQTLLAIYGALFPEIKANYHAWVERQLKTTKTIWMPAPVRFRKVFHSVNPYFAIDDNTLRSAYSCYPQCTIGAMLIRTLGKLTKIFRDDLGDELKDQWCLWYGSENWDRWRMLRDRGVRTPQSILWGGIDIRLNVHDSFVMSIPDDKDLVRWAAITSRAHAEVPIEIGTDTEDHLVVPVDFKKGTTLAAEDQVDYKLVA